MSNPDLERWRENTVGFQSEKANKTFGISLEREIEMPTVMTILGEVNGKFILDAGCGDGEFGEMLESIGGNVIGLDGSTAQLNQAKYRFSRSNFVEADLTNPLPFPDNSFHNEVSRFTLMFIKNLDYFAKESSRVVKNEGKMVLTVTHPFYPYLRNMLGDKHRYTGMNIYGEETKGEIEIGGQLYPFYYRPIGTYINSFTKNGFALTHMEEIVPSQGFIDQNPDLERMRGKPVFLTLGFCNTK